MQKEPKGKSREEIKAAKEKKRQIAQAKKMLIPAPKKTVNSMGLLSFDPSGAFRFEDGRWIKVYEALGPISDLTKVAQKVKERLRVSISIVPAKGESVEKKIYVSVIAKGDIYDDVRQTFLIDEEIMQEMIKIRALPVDEVVSVIENQLRGEKKSFSYASFVRSKQDLKAIISPEMKEGRENFQLGATFGMSQFVMEYPNKLSGESLSLLEKLGCPVFLTMDFYGISELEKEDYIRTLEKRYAKNLNEDSVIDFMNVSISLSVLCDSYDALLIVRKTIERIFSKAGFLIAPCFGNQKEAFLSQISLGLIDTCNFRNVGTDFMSELLRREYGSD